MATDTGQGDVIGDNNIKVFVRIKPPCSEEPGYTRLVDVDSSNTQVILRNDPNPRVFSFDHVADIDSKQEDIFSKLGKKVIENCMAGYNGTIFAYGQTGSGKTFTMMGPSEESENNSEHEQRGVIPRCFEYLYNLIAREKELHGDNKQFLCKCSFLEIYKEQIFDLLEPSSQQLHLRESLKTGVHVAGLSEKVVADASEAYEVLNSSWVNRKVASTSMNRESSRSHAVFTLQIESKEKKSGLGSIKTSCLNLVDLAGSERQKDTGATGLRLKEASSINKSLSNLGNVIMALVSISREKDKDKKRFIPYRDSKLTFLLRDSLGGNSETFLIACVHAGQKWFGETMSTLLFAKRAKLIKNKAVQNENATGNFQEMQALIKSLKEELQQYKMGLLHQPSIAPAESMPVLRKRFLQAMYLRKRSENSKQDLHVTLEKFRDVCEKKDRAIQTNKMIIKFRDNTIKRLEEKMKGYDVQDALQEDLRKEIAVLRSQVEHHPLIAKHALEVQRLKATIKSLKEDSGILARLHEDSEKIRALEEEYLKVLAEQQGIKDESLISPQRPDNVSIATVEKLRSQVADLESQTEELTTELTETKKVAEKNEMYKNGEIASYKKTVEELENVIAATKIRSKLEKAALNEQHLQTVMTITTPKKECYKLRNRTVVAKGDTPDLDSTIPFEDENSPKVEALPEEEGILQEDVPQDIAQQAQEALLEQIKKLQEKNAGLEARFDEFETDRVKQLHNQSVTESQLRSLEELLDKERQLVSSIRDQLSQVEPKLKVATEEKENAVGETRDLRLLLAQADKDLKEYKEKVKALELEKKNKREEIESKHAEVALALEQVMKENERKTEEIDCLGLSLEAETLTRQFMENQVLKFEQECLDYQGVLKTLRQDLQNAEKTILDEKEHRDCLVQQLCCESTEKDKELVKQLEDNKNLMIENTSLKNIHEESSAKHRKDIEEKDSRILHLEKFLKGTEEKVLQYYNRLEEQNDKEIELKQKLGTVTEQMNFYEERKETMEKSIEHLNSDLAKKIEELEEQKCKHAVEMEMLNEDLRGFEELNKECNDSQKQLQESKEQCSILSNKIKTLELTLEEKNQQLKERETTKDNGNRDLALMTETLAELERSREEKAKEIAQLSKKNENLTDEYQEAIMECESLKSEYQFANEKLETQSKEIAELSKRCYVAEKRASDVESDRNQAQSRLMELESNFNEMKQEIDSLTDMKERMLVIAEKNNKTTMSQKSELDAIKLKLKEVCSKLGVSETEGNVSEFEALIHGIEKMMKENQALFKEKNELVGHSNHKQKIKYHEQLKERYSTLNKDHVALLDKNRHLQDEIKELKNLLKMSEVQLKDSTAGVLKENKMPQHKMFLSGDFSQRSPHLSEAQHKNGQK